MTDEIKEELDDLDVSNESLGYYRDEFLAITKIQHIFRRILNVIDRFCSIVEEVIETMNELEERLEALEDTPGEPVEVNQDREIV